MDEGYYSGTVESYNDRAGFGIILPDDPEQPNEKYIVSRNSLRERSTILEPGTRIQFRKEFVHMGTLARDVHREGEIQTDINSSDIFDSPGIEVGVVKTIISQTRYGFIQDDKGTRIFFHFNDADPNLTPVVGMNVQFTKRETAKGPQAFNISGTDPAPEAQGIVEIPTEVRASRPRNGSRLRTPYGRRGTLRSASDASARVVIPDVSLPTRDSARGVHSADLMAQAILAREARQLDKAAALYALGMRNNPSVQLVLSYAALEKNRNRKPEAMRIYEQGMRIHRDNAKLHEDAGVLAASVRDYPKAIGLLSNALSLYRRRGSAGTTQVLQWLARLNYQIGNRDSLLQCIKYFDEEASSRGNGRSQMAANDALLLNLARVRTQHERGSLTFKLFTQAGRRIRRANLHDQITVGADLIVEFQDQELKESYGLGAEVLVRCMFQNNITRHDIDSFDEKIRDLGSSGLVDEQLGFLVVASLTPGLEAVLFARISDRKQARPAIIPLTQREIEESLTGGNSLRDVLNRWLYRRDLFAVNSPVVGRRFFGRDKQLAQVRDAISMGTCIGVFGLRKVGKTSLLKEAQRKALEAGNIVAFIDLLTLPDGVADASWIYWKIASQLAEQCPRLGIHNIRWQLGGKFSNFLEIPAGFPIPLAFDADLGSILRALRLSALNPNPKVVVLLDEIERLLPNEQGKVGFTGYFDFLGYLRGMAQQSSDFVVVVTGANAAVAEVGQFAGRDNPVFNFFSEMYLPLLQPEECDLMIQSLGRGMGLRFNDAALHQIYELTGGHPFFARHLCSYIAEQCADRPLVVSQGLVTGLIDYYMEFCASHFAEITERLVRDYKDEFEILKVIAADSSITRLDQLRVRRPSGGMALKHLVGYQLVQLNGGEVSLSMELFRHWLKWAQI